MWALTKPVKAEANQQTVKDLVANLKDLKVDSKVNLKLDDDVRKDKQLDAAHAVHVRGVEGRRQEGRRVLRQERRGRAARHGGRQAGRRVGGEGLLGVPLHEGAEGLPQQGDLQVRRRERHAGDDREHARHASFTKGATSGPAPFDGKPIARFDEEKVKDMLRAYKALNADDFGDGKSLADTGLDKPEATVTVHLKDGAEAPELLVGKVVHRHQPLGQARRRRHHLPDHELRLRLGNVGQREVPGGRATPARRTQARRSSAKNGAGASYSRAGDLSGDDVERRLAERAPGAQAARRRPRVA